MLADRDEYRRAIAARAARFAALYPRLKLGAAIAGFAVPAILVVVFAFTPNSQLMALATWVVWVLLIIGFLLVIEMMQDSIQRQVALGTLDDETIRRSLAERSRSRNRRRRSKSGSPKNHKKRNSPSSPSNPNNKKPEPDPHAERPTS